MRFQTRRTRNRRVNLTHLKGTRLKGVIAALASVLLIGGVLAPTSALADPPPSGGATAVLDISQSVDHPADVPGNSFTYSITVDCSSAECTNATLTDVIPAQFDALTLDTTVAVTPPEAGASYTASWGGPNNRTLTLGFTEVGGAPGIAAGDGYTVQITMSVPAGLSPDFGANGIAVPNPASVSADDADTKTSSQNVTVTVPITVNAAVTKAWSPSTAQYKVGAASTVTLTAQNASNALATSVVLQDPSDPTSASSPFQNVDFASFGAMTLPQGADEVFVDAYVAGSWVAGTTAETASTLALPAGVTPGQVEGLRLTFESSTGTAALTAMGTAGSAVLNLTQRAATRADGTSLVHGATDSNTASSTVVVPGQTPVTKTATATYVVTGLTAAVSATKSFQPSTIAAGTSSLAEITAANASNGPLSTMTVAEPSGGSFFTPLVTFGGFTSGSSWPVGATDASIVWAVNTGTAPTSPDFTSVATMPSAPTLVTGQYITGFTISYTGAIAVGSTAGVFFTVDVAADENTDNAVTVSLTNNVLVSGSNDAGNATPEPASATLSVLAPQILITESKTITPSASTPIAPGGHSTVQLPTQVIATAGYLPPTSIIITDMETGSATDYWNAFNAVAVAPTQVPLGATLVVSYTTDGTDWTALPLQDATSAAMFYSAVLPGASSIVGVKFDFEDVSGFSLGSKVTPAIAFEARGTLRGGGPTAVVGTPVTYTNSTVSEGDATVTTSTGSTVSIKGASSASSTAAVKVLPGGDNGTILSKAWQLTNGSATVISQSSQTRTATISWGTQEDGATSAVISDPADPTNPADPTVTVANSVFQAFDLTQINAITTTTDPLIAFDQVTSVQLLSSTGTWSSVGACTDLPMNPCQGGLPAIPLNSTQSANTVGVQLTIVPDDALRAASHDPLTPAVGSGLASSPAGRPITLTFTIRNTLRDAADSSEPSDPWVVQGRTYNTPDNGVVKNTVYGTYATTAGTVTDGASDSIDIVDPTPAISSTKTAATPSLAIPNPGDVLVTNYPTDSYTLTATNASAAHTWDMRITDPMPCPTANPAACVNNDSPDGTTKGETINPFTAATYDPSTNPFEDFNITSIVPTAPSGGSLGTSSIIFEYYTPATSTVAASTTFSAPILLSSAELTTLKNAAKLTTTFANVVGFSILFASSSTSNGGTIAPSTGKGTVVVGTQLRETSRSTSAFATPTNVAGPLTVTNNSFTQDYDDVFPDANIYDSKSASVNLTVGTIKVTASKTMALVAGGTTLLEANRTADVAVNLGATSGSSDAASDRVIITDSGQNSDGSPALFWQAFTLKSIGTITPPLGANQVEVDAQVDGSTNWTAGTPTPFTSPAAPSNALPAGVTAAHVTGLRFIFTKTDGSIFSNTAPAAAWTAAIPLVADLKSSYLSGQTFSGTVPNTVTTTSHHPIFGTASATATASLTLGTGTFTVDVVKTPSVATTPAGQFVDWTLQFTNTGTGYLKNPVIVDQLPIDASLSAGGPLLFDPTAVPTYTDAAGGQLTASPTQSYNASNRQITYTWPTGSQLAPGEVYQIVVSLQVAPGLQQTYGNVVNAFTFSSDQTLASCTNTSGTQGETLSGKSCSTTNFVTVLSASAITTFKGVKGNVDASGNSTSGATNVTSTSTPCTPDSDGFYRTPCAANTVIGGTDLWKLQVVNGGNISSTGVTVADVLPHAGDTLMRTSTSRGSTYTPQFAGDVSLVTDSLSAGTAMTWQVTSSANPCPNYDSDPTCSTATWVTGPAYLAAHSNSYNGVTGIRVTFDFSALAGGTLPPAATLKVTYETLNVPSQTAGDHGVPTTVPSATSYAWNTFGAYALFGPSPSRIVEPVKAGVEIATGPIQVNKVVSGASASYAPLSYTMTATCAVDGVQLTLPSGGAMSVNSTSTVPYSTRLDGLPVGSVCSIVEAASGASAVGYAPANGTGTAGLVTVSTAGASGSVVPASQQVTVTNTYGTTDLTITKRVSTTATVGSFGPFSFSMSCTVNNGASLIPVTFPDGSTTETFSLAKDASDEIDNLPVDAVCTLRETDSDNATSISASIDGGSPVSATQGGAISVPLAAGSNHTAVVTNTYAGGQLAIMKTVSDAGSIQYGSGPFTVSAVCTYQGQTLYDSSPSGTDPATSIVGGQTITLAPVFPVGTSCAVAETDAGGATSSSGPATVLIVGPTGLQTTGLVTTTITNTFAKGSLKITKVIDVAPGAIQDYGSASYQATVVCTWVKDGTTLTIPLPNGGVVNLTAAGGYTATVTGLIAGASCGVVESATGGATTSVVSAISPSTIPANGESDVTITNTFGTGSLVIDKDFAGTSDAIARFGQGPTHTYTAAIACQYLSNGVDVPINLGPEATVSLTSANGYSAEIDGLLDGATCSVTETNVGLAVSSSLSPNNGTVTVVDSSELVPATVAITNTFVVGKLDLVKTASTALTQGSATYSYTLAVSNPGTIDAPGVTVADPIDPTLDVTSIDYTGWTSCSVTGADPDNYGGSLGCELGSSLPAGASAPTITMHVTVLDTISQDEIDNTATVCSTSTIFDCATGSVNVPVKWIDVTASSVCVKDAPYLQYSIDAHNLDVSGHTLTVSWADKNGNFVHADTAPITANGLVTGTMLWPGAAVDSSGDATSWPGYRLALPGETPDWNGLVLDPTLPTYALRDDPLITFSINPHRTVTVAYPPASADCTSPQPTNIAVTKTASVSIVKATVPFTYTITSKNVGLGPVLNAVLTDPVPATLHVTKVTSVPAAPGMPDWTGCTLTGVNPDGGGGTVTCELDRPLTYQESAPDVILTAFASVDAPIGTISNTATLKGDPPVLLSAARMSVNATAVVLDSRQLGFTGVIVVGNLVVAVGMLLLGLLFVGIAFLWPRRRRRPRHA